MVCSAIKIYNKKVSTHTHTVIDWYVEFIVLYRFSAKIERWTNLNCNNRTKEHKIWTSPSIGTGNRKRIELKKKHKSEQFTVHTSSIRDLFYFQLYQTKGKAQKWCDVFNCVYWFMNVCNALGSKMKKVNAKLQVGSSS